MKKFAILSNLCYNSNQLYEKGKFCHKDQGVKFMKKALFTGAVVTLLCVPSVAFAKGTAGIKFEGQNNVNVGDEFTVNMVIDSVNDTEYGVVGLGGYITYDTDVLELVNTEQGNSYEILINRNNNKIIGIDYTMENGIKERTNMFKLTFRAKAAGDSNITLTEGEVEDRYDSIDFNVNGLYVTSNEAKVEENVAQEEVKIEENNEIYVEKEENSETQISVEPTNVENKKNTTTKKVVKNPKKTAKKAAKKKKNIFEIVKTFFTNIIKM